MSPSLNPAQYQHLQLRSERDLGVYATLFWRLDGLSPSERQEGMPKDGIKPSTTGSR